MPYRATRERGEENVIRLNVLYKDPIKDNVIDVRFRLIPPEGVFAQSSSFSQARILITDTWNPDSEFREQFHFPDVESSISSEPKLTTAFEWLTNCLASHSRCNRPGNFTPDWHPTRLIDIGSKGDSDWRLCIMSEDGISSPSAPCMTLKLPLGTQPDPAPALLYYSDVPT